MGSQVEKKAKAIIFGPIFLIEIDSEWSKTYFKTKISISKKNYYDWTAIFSKNGNYKNLGTKNIFWSESIQNCPKRILNRKSRFQKKEILTLVLSKIDRMEAKARKDRLPYHTDQKFKRLDEHRRKMKRKMYLFLYFLTLFKRGTD